MKKNMTKKKITGEVLKKIKDDDITPVPKWRCYFWNFLFWAGVVLAVFLSSSFLSLALMNLMEIPFSFKSFNHLRILISLFPLLWFVLIVIFLILAFLIFNKTKRAYRYQLFAILAGLVFLMIVFTLVLNRFKIDRGIRNFTDRNFSQAWVNRPFDRACHHETLIEKGLLGGEIVDRKKDFVLVKNGLDENWKVIITPETRIKRRMPLMVGDKVMVTGDKLEEFVFKAWVIKKVEGRR